MVQSIEVAKTNLYLQTMFVSVVFGFYLFNIHCSYYFVQRYVYSFFSSQQSLLHLRQSILPNMQSTLLQSVEHNANLPLTKRRFGKIKWRFSRTKRRFIFVKRRFILSEKALRFGIFSYFRTLLWLYRLKT